MAISFQRQKWTIMWHDCFSSISNNVASIWIGKLVIALSIWTIAYYISVNVSCLAQSIHAKWRKRVFPRVSRNSKIDEQRRFNANLLIYFILFSCSFPVDGNAYLVSNSYTNSDNALARETAYRLFLYPDDQQQELLTKLLNHRHDLAVSCGFPTYAHRALKSGTVESPPLVMDFLDKLSEQLRPQAEADFHIMTQMKQADLDGNSVLGAWDTPYYTSQYKKEWLKVSPSEYAPYFSLGACMEGINNVMKALYGVRFEYADLERGETWSNDIYKLNVVHESEGLLGQIYCDFYERPGKPAQDCHFTMRGSKQLADGSFQNPIVVVMLNLCPPRWSGPTLLTPALVDNLFHEMGHAMHSMLARTQYQHVSGTRCSTDFAEVPSVLMEYFASDPRVLSTFARHFQTQEAMPMSLMKRLCISKRLFSASETQLQIFYSALDQVYHGDPKISDSVTTTDILKQVQQKYYSIPYVEHTVSEFIRWKLKSTNSTFIAIAGMATQILTFGRLRRQILFVFGVKGHIIVHLAHILWGRSVQSCTRRTFPQRMFELRWQCAEWHISWEFPATENHTRLFGKKFDAWYWTGQRENTAIQRGISWSKLIRHSRLTGVYIFKQKNLKLKRQIWHSKHCFIHPQRLCTILLLYCTGTHNLTNENFLFWQTKYTKTRKYVIKINWKTFWQIAWCLMLTALASFAYKTVNSVLCVCIYRSSVISRLYRLPIESEIYHLFWIRFHDISCHHVTSKSKVRIIEISFHRQNWVNTVDSRTPTLIDLRKAKTIILQISHSNRNRIETNNGCEWGEWETSKFLGHWCE